MSPLIRTVGLLSAALLCAAGCGPDPTDDISSSSCMSDIGGDLLPTRFDVTVPAHVKVVRCHIVRTWDSDSLSVVFDGSPKAADRLLGQYDHQLTDLTWNDDSILVRDEQWGMDKCFPDGLNGKCSYLKFQTDIGYCAAVAEKIPNGTVRLSLSVDKV